MKVVFSDRSRARLHEIQSYIAFYDIRAAAKVVDRIIYATEMLSDHPRLGPTWSGGRTRALVVSGLPYASTTGRPLATAWGERLAAIVGPHTADVRALRA